MCFAMWNFSNATLILAFTHVPISQSVIPWCLLCPSSFPFGLPQSSNITFVVDAMNVQGGKAFFSRHYTPELRVEHLRFQGAILRRLS
jgi:hypothetical protein